MPEISQKARQVLEYLTQRESSIPPTVREIGAALQIKSTSTVHKYLTGNLSSIALSENTHGKLCTSCTHKSGDTYNFSLMHLKGYIIHYFTF